LIKNVKESQIYEIAETKSRAEKKVDAFYKLRKTEYNLNK
jgi:hypothetical protein